MMLHVVWSVHVHRLHMHGVHMHRLHIMHVQPVHMHDVHMHRVHMHIVQMHGLHLLLLVELEELGFGCENVFNLMRRSLPGPNLPL